MKKVRLLGMMLGFFMLFSLGNFAMAHEGKDITVTGKVTSTLGMDGKAVTSITDAKSGKTYALVPTKKMGALPASIKVGETASVYGDPIVGKDGSLSLKVEKVK